LTSRPASVPRIFVASNGKTPLDLEEALACAVLLRDLDLETLIQVAESARPPLALDIDSVEGLNADAIGVRFVVAGLGISVVFTRRPAIALRVAELGALGLLRVLAFDSTGLERSIEGHASLPGVGTAISPGPVVAHLSMEDIARLPRPLVAYGLIPTAAIARSLLRFADSVVLAPDMAIELHRLLGPQVRAAFNLGGWPRPQGPRMR
jgi:glycerol-3-phosphate responsive antiterminator